MRAQSGSLRSLLQPKLLYGLAIGAVVLRGIDQLLEERPIGNLLYVVVGAIGGAGVIWEAISRQRTAHGGPNSDRK